MNYSKRSTANTETITITEVIQKSTMDILSIQFDRGDIKDRSPYISIYGKSFRLLSSIEGFATELANGRNFSVVVKGTDSIISPKAILDLNFLLSGDLDFKIKTDDGYSEALIPREYVAMIIDYIRKNT